MSSQGRAEPDVRRRGLHAAGGSGKLFEMANSTNVTIRNSDFQGGGSGVGFWVNKSDGITLREQPHQGLRDRRLDRGDRRPDGQQQHRLGHLARRHDHRPGPRRDDLGKLDHASTSAAGPSTPTGSSSTTPAANDPMTNVTVQNNRIETNNQMSHGIYAANGIANRPRQLLDLLPQRHDRPQHRRQRPGERHRGRPDHRAEDHQQHPAAGHRPPLQPGNPDAGDPGGQGIRPGSPSAATSPTRRRRRAAPTGSPPTRASRAGRSRTTRSSRSAPR